MPGFPEPARVGLGAENDNSDLRSTLRQTKQCCQTVASLSNKTGLSAKHVHVSVHHKLVCAVDTDRAASGMKDVILLLHDLCDAMIARDMRNETSHVVRGGDVVGQQP